MTGRLLKFRLPPTHMMRVADDRCAPAYWAGYWMGVRRGYRPVVDRDWIFTNRQDGSTILGRVLASDADGWRVQQFNPKKKRSLARSRWRPMWRVRYVHHSRGAEDEWHNARALGDHERAAAIMLAIHGKGSMPPPLPAGTAVPTIYGLPEGQL